MWKERAYLDWLSRCRSHSSISLSLIHFKLVPKFTIQNSFFVFQFGIIVYEVVQQGNHWNYKNVLRKCILGLTGPVLKPNFIISIPNAFWDGSTIPIIPIIHFSQFILLSFFMKYFGQGKHWNYKNVLRKCILGLTGPVWKPYFIISIPDAFWGGSTIPIITKICFSKFKWLSLFMK